MLLTCSAWLIDILAFIPDNLGGKSMWLEEKDQRKRKTRRNRGEGVRSTRGRENRLNFSGKTLSYAFFF
jgi:hypothetical protein